MPDSAVSVSVLGIEVGDSIRNPDSEVLVVAEIQSNENDITLVLEDTG